MFISLINRIFLALALFNIAVLAERSSPALVLRQEPEPDFDAAAQVTAINLDDPQCQEYSRIANLSAIGGNTTLRATYLFVSTEGTHSDLEMLLGAAAASPAMTMNAALNEQCGNLTTIALAEADRNFTMGIVGRFSGAPAELVPNVSPDIIFCVIFAVLFMGTPWLFMLG